MPRANVSTPQITIQIKACRGYEHDVCVARALAQHRDPERDRAASSANDSAEATPNILAP
jgi:hypothetical protein